MSGTPRRILGRLKSSFRPGIARGGPARNDGTPESHAAIWSLVLAVSQAILPDVITFPLICDLSVGDVQTEWAPSTRRIVPEVEQAVEDVWQQKLKQPKIRLWDGPLCRMEGWELTGGKLRLRVSRTSYKTFLGTNMHNPHLLDQYGNEVGANSIGVSPALETADGYLMLGKRNDMVAYYPNRIHPFAGALEPEENPFDAVQRELREELHLTDIAEMRLLGIAEDKSLRQPEMIFSVRTHRTRAEIEATLQKEEHHETWSENATREGLEEALKDVSQFTPVAVASLMLWGRRAFGAEWMHQ